jgi:hypothetical protein
MAGPAAMRRSRPPALPRGSRLTQATGVVACPQGDGVMLLDMGAGRRLTLDEFGGRVWRALADGPSLAALLARLRDDDVPADRLAEDVTRLLARWGARDLIIWY